MSQAMDLLKMKNVGVRMNSSVIPDIKIPGINKER